MTHLNTSVNYPYANLLTCYQDGRDVTATQRIHELHAVGLPERTKNNEIGNNGIYVVLCISRAKLLIAH